MACLREIVAAAGADPGEPMEERAAWRFIQQKLIGANDPTLWWWIAQTHERLFPGREKPLRFDESREPLFRMIVAEIERLEREPVADVVSIFRGLDGGPAA